MSPRRGHREGAARPACRDRLSHRGHRRERRDISGVPVHLDYRELLARSDVNAVDIVPPNDLHTEAGVAALERGADVLLEKPMARTAEECDVLMAAAARSGRILSIGHDLRLSAQSGRIKAMIDAGRSATL